MSKRKVLSIALAVAGIGVAVGGAGLAFGPPLGGPPGKSKGPPDAAKNAPRDTDPIAVTTATATTRPVQRTVSVVGSLFGRDEMTISAKVEGTIRKLQHDVGDEVKPGDVLLEIDPTGAELAVEEAQKALELELAKLGLKEPPQDSFDVLTLPSLVRTAAKEKYASSKYERAKNTRTSLSSTLEEFQQAEFEYRDAKEAHRQAQLDAATTLAAVRQRQASLNTARQRLNDMRVVVPSAGTYTPGGPTTYVVAQRNVSEGEQVRPGSGALFRLVVADTLKLQAAIGERHLGEVQVGQKVTLRVEAYPQESFAGVVSRVNPTVDRASLTFQIEVAVPNANRKLAPGSFAKAEVQTRLDKAAVLVPEESLVTFAGVTKVFVVRDSKAVAVIVKPTDARVDANQAPWVEVTGGLRSGERIVTSGQTKLTDGRSVRVRSEAGKGNDQ